MRRGESAAYRQEDYAGIGEPELTTLYDEGRRRLEEYGAVVPEVKDPVLDPAELWVHVAFLESVLRYEEADQR